MTSDGSFVLLRDDAANETSLFVEPERLVVARDRQSMFSGLEALEKARHAGKWIAGFMSYEAGYLFEPKLQRRADLTRETPLMAFGIFDGPAKHHPLLVPRLRTENTPLIENPKAAWTLADYTARFEKLHWHLRQGDCYQANLTMPVSGSWHGDPVAAFWSLIARQPVKYGALVNLGGPILLSRSPELFFRVDKDSWIEAHPMKGTAPRGTSPGQDEAIIAAMKADEKTQAENRMIVDLLRNDISRITETGTLSVPKLFDVETYPTVHQMVSHVRAKLLPDLAIVDLFAALFPCGSVTGAPKMRAMEILHDLEAGPRDAYCGAIGVIRPDGTMCFNVAIRTISLFDDGRAVFNVGGGIVFDSDAESEYEECLLKARFATGDEDIRP
jgi:para-aminobenzoate synthetase component 1